MEKILKISIPTYSQRQKSKPHIVYHISVTAPVRSWTVQHRYSEFFTLNKKFLDLGLKPPLELPPKTSIFSFTAYDNPKFVETRRQGLEEYLQAILASKDERFKKLPEWREFLGLSHLRNKANSVSDDGNGGLTSPLSANNNDHGGSSNSLSNRSRQGSFDLKPTEQWLDECRNLNVVINEIRTCIAARNKFVTRNETAAACEALVMARKNHSNLCTRYAALERELQRQLDNYYNNAQQSLSFEDSLPMSDSNPGIFSSVLGGGVKKQKNKILLSKGELSRRQDLLENIRKEKEQLEKLLGNMKSLDGSSGSTGSTNQNNVNIYSNVKVGSAGHHSNSLENSFGSPSSTGSGLYHTNSGKSKPRRKFGVNISKEVEESTQGLDNKQILQLQKDMLQDQDKTLEQFTAIISRQRRIGETISQELDLQSELLEDLDSNVNKVQVSLGQAEKRMKKVLKK